MPLSWWERAQGGGCEGNGPCYRKAITANRKTVLKYFKVHSHRTIAKTKPFLGVYQSAIYSGIGFPHKTVVSDVAFV